MIVSPTAEIYLIKDVYIDKEHTIDFNTIDEQTSFFMSKMAYHIQNCTFVRKDNIIKAPIEFDSLININYLMFSNGNKWYYCYITKKEYINANMTALTIELDVLQTYQFEYALAECFIEREHQNRWQKSGVNFIPKYNTVEENINYGKDYKLNTTGEVWQTQVDNVTLNLNAVKTVWFMVIASDQRTEMEVRPDIYNAPTAFDVFFVPYDLNNPNTRYVLSGGILTNNPLVSMNDLVQHYISSTIVSVTLIPYLPLQVTLSADGANNRVIINPVNRNVVSAKLRLKDSDVLESDAPAVIMCASFVNGNPVKLSDLVTTVRSYTMNNFIPYPMNFAPNTPINISYESKLYSHPYYYFSLTNYWSAPLIIKPQYLAQTFNVKYLHNLGVDSKSKYWIEGYLGDNLGKEKSIIDTSIHELPITTDYYTTYLRDHKATATTGLALNVAEGIVMGAVSGGVAGAGMATANGLIKIQNEMLKQQDLKNTPDSVRSMGNNVDFDLTDNNVLFRFNVHSITDEYRNLIHKYFHHYGYKANAFKIPDLKSRYYFNFIKTVEANIKGNLDKEIIEELKNIYDKGLTIWHYRNSTTFIFKDYSKENVEFVLM